MLRKVSRSSPIVIAAALLAASAVAGCSSGVSKAPNGTTVASIISSMKAAFRTAKSVRMSGTATVQGHVVTMDLSMLRSGEASGTIKVGPLEEQIVVTGGNAYIYVSKSFFKFIQKTRHAPASECALICGKWVKSPAGNFSGFNLTSLGNQFEKNVPNASSVPSLKTTTFDGQAVYEVTDSAGAKGYIAQTSPHYLLGVTVQTSQGHSTITFSEWNAVPPISPPPANKVIGG